MNSGVSRLMSVKRVAIAALIAAGTMLPLAPAMAQEVSPDVLALARKYIELTDNASIYEVTLVENALDLRKTLTAQNPSVSKQVDASITKILEDYRGHKNDLLDQFARVYALRFTPDELQQIVDFYSSPTGVKLAKANLAVNQDLKNIMQVFTNNLRTEFLARVRADLKAQGVSL